VPILLRRILTELFQCGKVDVLQPIRIPRSKLVKTAELLRAVALADLKLKQLAEDLRKLIVVVFDADADAACQLGPQLQSVINDARPDLDVAVTLAVAEYETWFIAAAESLMDYVDIEVNDVPVDPEGSRLKKAWLQRHFRGRYTETIEQPALTAKMDLNAVRRRSPSFDKLCRELARRVFPTPEDA
jgi:hypothetical protein